MDTLFSYGAWTWLVLGLILIVLEAVLPGVFFIWLGIAALLTGIVDWLFGWSWQANLVVFASLALVSVLAGWMITRRREEEVSDSPMLNRRTDALIGKVFPLDRAIISGEGRIRVGDSVWRVFGPEMPAGTRVRIARSDGANLYVEAAE